ncbi:unnamed protein product [Caenorhabditis auriculariae]|uniref:SSD domain-containing protein n=1 Tax=Caenorhabditis auriculariae TaxID=2777116 RepID=A0A8S1GPE6_9PELO|nr:unnamed protein product [Caenorhabditis auriculariae]
MRREEKFELKFGCLERVAANFFHSYGLFVARHPAPFIVGPLLLALSLATGLISLTPLSDAVYLYTPTDAPSKFERRVIHDAWPLVDGSYVPGRAVTQTREAQIAVVAREGANILEENLTNVVKRLDRFIRKDIQVTYENQTYRFDDLCLKTPTGKCADNDHVALISRLFNHGINVTYPTFRVADRSAYLGSALGGVKLGKGHDGQNILMSASSWLLLYQLQFYPNNISYISALWEQEFKLRLDDYPKNEGLLVTYFHSQTLSDELTRNAERLAPKFVAAFVILIVFSVICSVVTIKDSIFVDWVVSKPLLSVLGVMNAAMGIASAMGGLIYLGIPYNDIIAVMPFLVVAVGTDNMFLMVASLKRTDRSLKSDQRVAECMADAAVSILITATTDALSFGVGTITTIPSVQIFCLYTMCAISFTFFYQVTFFCALLVYATRAEEEGLHSIWNKPAVAYSPSSPFFVKLFWLGSKVPTKGAAPSHVHHQSHCLATSFFKNWYAPILMHPVIRSLAGLWYCIYLIVAAYGCTQLKEGLEPANLLVDDSYATPHYRVLKHLYWHYGASLQIVVNDAPDLRIAANRREIDYMVSTFARNPMSIGEEGVQFWMEEMSFYYASRNISIIDEKFYEMAARYIYSDLSNPWVSDVAWSRYDSSHSIRSFRFMIGMRDISTTTRQTAATNAFRDVASLFPKFNVTTYMPLWLFTDQYALVVPNTIQDIVIAVICMLFISSLLIPQAICALWVAVTIASIDIGVLGFMTLWGVNLDAISMITIIMSVGFSVDYSAHITYAYVISKESTPARRVCDALGDLGWPVAQGATSTILAVVVLADVPAYMIITFFKTVFLAISIGFLHGLVFLPLLLSVFVGGCCSTTKQIEKEGR